MGFRPGSHNIRIDNGPMKFAKNGKRFIVAYVIANSANIIRFEYKETVSTSKTLFSNE